MGRIERQERAREEMRDTITAAAMKLFLKNGFEKTSIRRIADAIGYTPGSIYSYFKDKDEILYALHVEGFDKLYALQRELDVIADPKARLIRSGEVYLHFAMNNPEYYNLMFIMEKTGRKIEEHEDWECGLRAYEWLRDTVRACMEAGVMPQGELEVATFGMWAQVHGLASLVVRRRAVMIPEEHLEAVVQGALHFVMEGLMR